MKNDEYDVEKAEKQKQYWETELLQLVEKQRMDYLSKTYDPKNNWWGSKVTVD